MDPIPQITIWTPEETIDYLNMAEAALGKVSDTELKETIPTDLSDPFFRLYRLSTADGRFPEKYESIQYNSGIRVYYNESKQTIHIHLYADLQDETDWVLQTEYIFSDLTETPFTFLADWWDWDSMEMVKGNIPATLTFTKDGKVRIHFSGTISGDIGLIFIRHKFPKGTFSIKPKQSDLHGASSQPME